MIESKIMAAKHEVEERLTVDVVLTGAPPRARYRGRDKLWRPDRLKIKWRRHYDPMAQEWSGWYWDATVQGPWLRKDGSDSDRPWVLDYVSAWDKGSEFLPHVEATQPVHPPPAVSQVG